MLVLGLVLVLLKDFMDPMLLLCKGLELVLLLVVLELLLVLFQLFLMLIKLLL